MAHWISTWMLVLLVGSSTSTLCAQDHQAVAKSFGRSLIQSYFDNNCQYVADHLGDQLYSLEAGITISVDAQVRHIFCKDSPLRDDIPVSFDLYEQNYVPKIYDKAAFTKAFPEWAKHIQWKKGDLFFHGGNPRAAGHTRLFKSERQVQFLLRRQGDGWLIVGF